MNKKIEKAVKDIKESGGAKEIVKEIRKEIESLKVTAENLIKPDIETLDQEYNFTIGAYASVKNSTASGKIIELNEAKKKATLLVGTIKMQVKLTDLIPSEKTKKSESINNYDYFIHGDSAYRLDIRGDRPEEVEYKVTKFIDDAYQSSLGRVEILHGKGTGALKKTVTELLKSHDKVKTFYFAPLDQGGEGITVAEIL